MPSAETGLHLAFLHNLQALTTKIHATGRLDELLTEISPDVCVVFGCERFTFYVVSDDGRDLIAKVKTGLEGVRELRIAINDRSLAGFAANHKQLLNISDVYDKAELNQHGPNLQFLQVVDQKTGFHSREMLVAPILNDADGTLLGVVQLINQQQKQPFSPTLCEGAQLLAKTLSVALKQRKASAYPFVPQHKYHQLIDSKE